MKTALLCLSYLGVIVAANLLVAAFGPSVSILNAFLAVGFVLVIRDVLHERWAGDWRYMSALIGFGSIATVAISISALRVAIASGLAFAASEFSDYLVYQKSLGSRWLRSNKSNVVGAVVDSVVFPTIAFGGFSATITGMQFVAKVAGSLVFSTLILRKVKSVVVPAAIGFVALFSSPARAGWIADVGLGGVKTESLDPQPVAELFVATPDLHGFRLYGTASWTLDGKETSKPDVGILAITRGLLFRNNFWVAANLGYTGFKFEDFDRGHSFVGATVGIHLHGRVNWVSIWSLDIEDRAQTIVSKVTVGLI